MRGPPAGLGTLAACIVVAGKEAELVGQLIEVAVESELVLGEEVLKPTGAGLEGQQAVAEQLAHAVRGIEI